MGILDETLNGKDFLAEIEAQSEALRAELDSQDIGLSNSAAAIKKRRKKVLSPDGFDFFIKTYFSHHIWGERSHFQQHFIQMYPQVLAQKSGVKMWWIAPRGEGKSTLITKLAPLYAIALNLLKTPDSPVKDWLPQPMNYIVLLGAETKFPAKLIEVIKTELCHNRALMLDFPEVCGQGSPWRIGEIVTANGVKVESFGAEQAIRGTFHGTERPKLILGDDLITDKEAKSPTERENRWDWYNKAVSYLGPPDGSVKALNAATVLHEKDPVSRAKKTIGHVVHHFKAIEQLPERMDLWEQCINLMRTADNHVIEALGKSGIIANEEQLPSFQFYQDNKTEMDKGAIISWTSVRGLYQLMKARADNKKSFNTEMQGMPRDDKDKFFNAVAFYTEILQHWRYFGACDPSMGRGETSDPSALGVGAYAIESQKLHIIEAAVKRRPTDVLLNDLIRLQQEYNCQAWAFENNNAYEYMRTDFIQRGTAEGVPLPLIPVTAKAAKETRIESLQPFISGINPRILFHPRLIHLLDEMDTWPEKQEQHHYDGLDMLQLLWMVATTRSQGIPQINTVNIR